MRAKPASHLALRFTASALMVLWASTASAQTSADAGAAELDGETEALESQEDEDVPADADPTPGDMADDVDPPADSPEPALDETPQVLPDVLEQDPERSEVSEERKLERQTIRYPLLPPVDHPVDDAKQPMHPVHPEPMTGVRLHQELGTEGLEGAMLEWRTAAEQTALEGRLRQLWVPAPLIPLGPLGPTTADIPLTDNDMVRRWIRFFQGVGAKYMRKWVARYWRFGPTMRQILESQGMPSDLVCLSMIESGFSPKAYSFAHAAGPWQFIRATGVRMGLKVDFWVDERRDPVKSTFAAARYLRDLNRTFGDWWLAWAGYNAGPGKVHRAIKRQHSRQFFTLARGRYLRWETRNYVPKLIAAAVISKDPAAYGFGDVLPMPLFEFDVLPIDDSRSLSSVARACQSTVEALQELNPELRRVMTPPRTAQEPPYPLRVPKDLLVQCQSGMNQLTEDELTRYRRHRVRSGETLASVAALFGTTAVAIVRENSLPNALLREGEDLMVPVPPGVAAPVGDMDDEVRERRGRVVKAAPPRGTRPVYVTVKKGDTLWDIASSHDVDVRSVVAWNSLNRRKRLRVGQKIVVHVRDSRAVSKAP
jgi:membrane-bound lytic murein transglycosylase D